jgi:hypothetical protein
MPTPTKKPVNLKAFGEECEAGLPNVRTDIDAALKRQAYYDYDGFRYEADYKRDAESSFDFQGRPHRPSGFLRECVEILTEDVYSPGPTRKWSVKAGDDLLQQVYRDNNVDALLAEADRLCTLNDAAAIQIDAGEGDFTTKPVTYRVWGREQFHAWPSPDNPNQPQAVVVIDQYDLQTRYRLWSDTEVWTYISKKAEEWKGGRTFDLVSQEPHDYGVIPFAFFHYSLPIRDFFVSSIGELLGKAEIRIDDRLSLMDESIAKHLNPIPVAEGVPEAWKPIIEANRFIRMPAAAPRIGPTGGYEAGERARLYFLERSIDVVGSWDDLVRYINQCLEAARVPLSAARMEQSGVASGISLLVEQAPLLKRARKRRGMFRVYETDLGKRTLLCTGNHYGKPELVAAASKGNLVLGWPQPSVPIQTPDGLEMIQAEIRGGFKSYFMGLQQWYGVGRDEAVELAEQIEADNAELATVAPSLVETASNEPALPGQQTDSEEGSGQRAVGSED